LWSFGFNNANQLGLGTIKNESSPRHVKGLKDIAQISSGKRRTLALDTLGRVWSFGANNDGQLGTRNKHATEIVLVSG
jgi:alpha-tubulin suppressor-like RCC1 family protein